jgi:hypothetical protein
MRFEHQQSDAFLCVLCRIRTHQMVLISMFLYYIGNDLDADPIDTNSGLDQSLLDSNPQIFILKKPLNFICML